MKISFFCQMKTPASLLHLLQKGSHRALARAISWVENEHKGAAELLKMLPSKKNPPLVGITGPPGAGKSTLVNVLLENWIAQNKKIAIVAVDPTSPFNYGALLGDRIRLTRFFNHPNVYIRSVASRGSLGGLSEKIIEITDIIRAANFDYVLVETVGVGQSEVEVAGLADTTVVVLVPEAGDEIQNMKAGMMEIADIFVVNKSDREGANHFTNNLRKLLHNRAASEWQIPVVKTVATNGEGVDDLVKNIEKHHQIQLSNEKKVFLLTNKVFQLIQNYKMRSINRKQLFEDINKAMNNNQFNLYTFVERYF